MKKTILAPEASKDRGQAHPEPGSQKWITSEEIAEISVSSEDEAAPIENALDPDSPGGWKAGGPGEQLIRIRFNHQRPLRRIQLLFVEDHIERTQEFILRWAAADGGPREIVRQQWNFSPQGSTRELEDYRVSLEQVLFLELAITPDINHSPAIASLRMLRLA